MSAFILVDTKIKDEEAYERYKAQAKPLAESFGGVYRARGGPMEAVETDLWSPTRLVLIEFPDAAAAKSFLNSEAYAPVRAIRKANADCTLVIFEGS